MSKTLACAVALILLPVMSAAQSAGDVQKELAQIAQRLEPWATDPALLSAVKEQNARVTTLAEIQKADAAWTVGKNDALVEKVVTGACATRLRELSGKGGFGEAFIMDNRGALVCATERTTDYWQGDEAKWIKAFNDGKGATFIDRPKHDESSQSRLAQISVPVMDGGKAIGVITAGVIK